MKVKVCASLLAFSSLPLFADSNLAVEINKTSFEDNLIEAQSNAISVTYQHSLNENFSLNGRFGISLYDDEIDGLSPRSRFSVDSLASAYVRFDAFPEQAFNVFATLGYNYVNVNVNSSAGDFGETESDLGYGIGVSYKITEDYSVYLSGETLIDDTDVEMQSYNLGFAFKF